jgi:ankyrin repeat protein
MLRGHVEAAKAWQELYGLPSLSMTNGHGDDVLMTACWSGCAKAVEWILDVGGEPHGADKHGLTGLMIAIHRCDPETVSALVMAGANPESIDKQKKNALHHAAQCGLAELFPLLEDAGGDSEACDASGNSANTLLARTRKGEPTSLQAAAAHWLRRYHARLAF